MEDPRIPLLTPLLSLLRSRKFLVYLSLIVVSLVVVQVPQLETFRNELATLVLVLLSVGASVLTGTIAWEDVAIGRDEIREDELGMAVEDQLRRLIPVILDELLKREAQKAASVSRYESPDRG